MISNMLLLVIAANIVDPSSDGQTIQSKNDEFIFSKYPPRALAAGEQGEVRFRVDVNEKGLVLSCEVIQGSGHWRLDRETCDLIVNHATFKPTIDGDGKPRSSVHDGVVRWKIPGGTERAPPVKLVESKTPDTLICKRIPKTGSLVAHSRLCLTARDWSRYADETQDSWGDLQGRKGHTNGKMPTWPGT
jgi:TonB family protein